MSDAPQHVVPFTDMRLPDSETAQRTADADAALRAALKGNTHVRAVMVLEDLTLESVPRALAPHYAGADAAPRGFVVRAAGSMPLRTDERDLTALLLGGAELGSASSRYPLAVPASLSAAELEQRWATAHDQGRLPALDALAPHAHVGVYRAFDAASGSDRYYAIVRANDAANALHLVEEAQRTRPTLAALAKSAAYADVRESSQHVRDALARAAADALGVQLAQSGADCTTVTHAVVRAEPAAHQSQTPASRNDGTEEYVVYNGAADTSAAHNGALVYQGPLGGYAHVRNTHQQTLSSGFASAAWHTDQLSALSADAPHHVVGEHGEPALHRNTNDATRAAFARKLRWDGDASLHPAANERRALVTDQMVRETAPPVNDAQKLHVSHMHTVAAALPAHERSAALTIAELAAEARAHPDAAALPVPFDSDAMRTFTRHFDALDTEQTVADIMQMGTKVPLSPLLTQRSLCTEHRVDGAHRHAWYDDAARERTHECMQGADAALVRHRSVVMLPTKLIRDVAARVEASGQE